MTKHNEIKEFRCNIKENKIRCNIKENKIYVSLPSEYKAEHDDYYVHRKFRRNGNTMWGFFELNENYKINEEPANDFHDYLDYIKDFLDYNFSDTTIYEFNNLKEVRGFLTNMRMIKELEK